MSKEGQPGRDQSNTHSGERGGTHKESAGNAPRLSHEQLVKGFRDHREQIIQELHEQKLRSERLKIRHFPISPEDCISTELFNKAYHSPEGKRKFFEPIKDAWDILARDRFLFSPQKKLLSQSLGHSPGATTIKLDPFQTQIIDALTEAFDIPHERGQAEIEIPEELRSTKNG